MQKKKIRQTKQPEFTLTQAKRMYEILSYKDIWKIPLCVAIESKKDSAKKVFHTAVRLLARNAGVYGTKLDLLVDGLLAEDDTMKLIGEYYGTSYCDMQETTVSSLFEYIRIKPPELPALEMFGLWLQFEAGGWLNAEEFISMAESYFSGNLQSIHIDMQNYYCDEYVGEEDEFQNTIYAIRKFLNCFKRCRERGARELFTDPNMEGFFHVMCYFHKDLHYENRPELFIEQFPALLAEILGDYEEFTCGNQEMEGLLGVIMYRMNDDFTRVYREVRNLPSQNIYVRIFKWCVGCLPFFTCYSSEVKEINDLNRIYDIPEEGVYITGIQPLEREHYRDAYSAGSLFIPYILQAVLPELLTMLEDGETHLKAAA